MKAFYGQDMNKKKNKMEEKYDDMIERLNEIYMSNNYFSENMEQMKKQVGYQSPQ
jgi:hypothetical protein